jgi:hypothetical protein
LHAHSLLLRTGVLGGYSLFRHSFRSGRLSLQ